MAAQRSASFAKRIIASIARCACLLERRQLDTATDGVAAYQKYLGERWTASCAGYDPFRQLDMKLFRASPVSFWVLA